MGRPASSPWTSEKSWELTFSGSQVLPSYGSSWLDSWSHLPHVSCGRVGSRPCTQPFSLYFCPPPTLKASVGSQPPLSRSSCNLPSCFLPHFISRPFVPLRPSISAFLLTSPYKQSAVSSSSPSLSGNLLRALSSWPHASIKVADSLLPERNSWPALKITAFFSRLPIYYQNIWLIPSNVQERETQRTVNFTISTIWKHGRYASDRNIKINIWWRKEDYNLVLGPQISNPPCEGS